MIPLGSGSEWALWMDVTQQILLGQCLVALDGKGLISEDLGEVTCL